MMKRALMALLASAGILAPVAALTPQAVHASPSPCPIKNFSAAGSTSTKHVYSFAIDCFGISTGPTSFDRSMNINASYDVTTKEADEVLKTDDSSAQSTWTCPSDPWVTPSEVVCTFGSGTGSGIDPYIAEMYAPPITLTEPYSANYLNHDQAKANDDALEAVLTQARAANIFSERANRADGPLFDAKPAISLVDSQGAAITSTLVDVPLTIVGSGFLLHPHVTIHLDTANGQILGTANPDGGDFRQVFQGLSSAQLGEHTLVVTDGSVVVTQLTVTFNSLRLDPTRVSNILPSCLLCPVH